jgi:oligogalacturonide transporter
MNFLAIVEGIPIIAATVIIFIGRLWDAITDPIVGNISDKTKSKFGRRRFYFLLGIVPVFLSFVTLFYSFGITGTTAKIIYHTFAYMFFGTAFTIVMVPYNAILCEMTSDYNERTSYTTARMMMSGGASLVAAVLPSMIIKAVGGDVNGPEQKYGYLVMAIVLGVIFGLSWLVTFYGTYEREDLNTPISITLKEWLSVFQNKSFNTFIVIFISFQVAVDLMLALFIFYVDIVLLRYKSYELIMGLLLVFQMVFMALNGAIAKRKGKAFPLYLGMPIWILASLAFMFIDSSTSLILICVLAVLIAFGASAGNLSTWSMITDIYDVDEIMTRQRREGIYSGLTTFLRKCASGFAVLILGFGLQGMGFDQNEYNMLKEQSAHFDPATYAETGIVQGIKWMFVLIPIALLTITLIFAFRYKLNAKRFDILLKGIELYKKEGNLDKMPSEEKEDIKIITGKEIDQLWKTQ